LIHSVDYDRLRILSYPETHVFLVCFSLVTPSSYENIKAKWYSELQEHAEGTPIVLIGTKLDLKTDAEFVDDMKKKGITPITTDMGLKLKQEISAYGYVECSAKTGVGLQEVFQEAIRAALRVKPSSTSGKGGSCCVIL
jgi:Ras-related C3 botulinum toxin substrate 1